MTSWIAAYQAMRVLKWVLWAAFLGHSVYFIADRASHMNQFGHLIPITEYLMFVLPLGAVLAGLIELMLRDRAYPDRAESSAARG